MNSERMQRRVIPRFRWLGVATLLVCFAPGQTAAQSSLQPDGWDAGLKLADVIDINPDPRIVEVNLEARIARVEIGAHSVEAWTYNGTVPGPLIRVRVGDRLIAHFSNRLPQPTTVHWHGLRVPIQMDGVPEHSQPEVQPGDSFTYDFIVPDAGLFWYHPHVMSAAQVGFGLYGALLVEDPEERVGVADELVLVLSDMALEGNGTLEAPDSGGSTGMVFGREGTHVLVNGRSHSKLVIRAGAPQRWRIVNAAKSRYFNLDLGGTPFRQIGGDGGLQEYATENDTLLLAPGERADVIVAPRAEAGKELTLRANLFNRGFGSVEARFPYNDLVTIAVANLPPYDGPPPREVRRSIEPLQQAGATPVDLSLTLDVPAGRSPEYKISGALYSSRKNMLRARLGETQIWTVTNKTPWSHPLHLHGFFFQVIDEKGSPIRPMAWKDTINVPFNGTLRLIVRFDDREGRWMFHCHILDHAEGGLMGTFEVGAAITHGPEHSGH